MDQDHQSEHSASTIECSVAPRQSLEPGPSAYRASELAPSDVVVSSDYPAEHIAASPTHDQSRPLPVLSAPIPSVPNSGGTLAVVPLVSDQGPSSLPALGLNVIPERSIRRNPVLQTSPGFEEGDPERRRGMPLPPLPPEVRVRDSRIGFEGPLPPGPRSGIDYIVPVNGKTARERTVGERLQPTLLTAIAERDKYALKAKMTGYALNIVIGLQVILGALTTGLASVASNSQQTAIATAVLGGLSTLTASYLARARGSNEPELSITRVKDLEQFIRQCEAFQMDYGQSLGDKYNKELQDFRDRFEELLGNSDGQRRLAPV